MAELGPLPPSPLAATEALYFTSSGLLAVDRAVLPDCRTQGTGGG